MAYSKSDPRHPMNSEGTSISKVRPASSYGMKDRKKGRKMGINCSTGKYSTK